MVAENKKRKKKATDSERTNSDHILTNLTNMCNSVTTTSNEKHLANTDIKIFSVLLLHLYFLQNMLLFVSSISVGKGKLQKERDSSIMTLFAV